MKMSVATKKQIKQKTVFPMIAVLACVALLIASMFLPYITADDGYKELLEAAGQESAPSLFDISQMYIDEGDTSVAAILRIMAGLSAFAVLFAIIRMPVGVVIFDLLATTVAALVHFIFTNNNSGYFILGIGNRLIFVACAGVLASAIWMLVAKINAKKSAAKTDS